MNFKLLFKKNKAERSIITQFATIIGVTTFITLFFISSFNLYASVPIMNQVTVEKSRNNHAISSMILETFKTEFRQNNFVQTDKLAKELISANLIVFATVYDKKNSFYVWSSIPKLRGVKNKKFVPIADLFKDKLEYMNKDNLKEIKMSYGNYVLSTVFLNNDSVIPLINILFKGNLILAFIFIVFGFATALISAKIVTRPIKELVKGTEEFSKGNLSYRAKILANDEIGKLANAFNLMAGNLDHLYESLELQVKERTAELAEKKEAVEIALREVHETQSMLIHNEKMTSLGQLVAGVAHELNNPINFIYGNLEHLKTYVNDLINLITIYQKNESGLSDEAKQDIEKAKEDYDYLFIKEDLPSLIKSCKDGSERCKQIVLDLRNFSRLDEAVIKEVDLHEGLDSTLNILKNKYKNRISINKIYGNIPKLNCYAGQLNQVFMNILDNASYAIKENGEVSITTSSDEKYITIAIQDNGEGINQDLVSKIFDPFFTTKPVGQGTGLGLSISYKVIKKHDGIIEVQSEKNKGTKFTIKLPLVQNK